MTEPADATTSSSPHELFERFQRNVLSNASAGLTDDLTAEDIVVEWPFNPPGRPRRIHGRAAFQALAEQGRASLPVRFEAFRNVVVHQTTDPEVIVVEYDLTGTVTTTGRSATLPFVQVLKVSDGQFVHVREYQNILAMAEALGQVAELLASLTNRQREPAPPETGS
jgi:ketosteroid isomerase-like protein